MNSGIYYLNFLMSENSYEIYQTSSSDTVLMEFKSVVKIDDLFEKETVILESLSRCQVYIGSMCGCLELIWGSYVRLLNDTFGLIEYYNPDFFQELRDAICSSMNQVSKRLRKNYNFPPEWEYFDDSDSVNHYLGFFKAIDNNGFLNLWTYFDTNLYVRFIMEPEESLNKKAITIFTQVFNKYYPYFMSKDAVFKNIIDQYKFI